MEPYARMLDKKKKPTERMIEQYLGPEAMERLTLLEARLGELYTLQKELRFPFGNNYGWGYKYTHGRKHLCYAFFEESAFTVTLQLGDESAPRVEEALPSLLPETQERWANRYPCGDHGGWIHYRVLSDEVLEDVIALIELKLPPRKKSK